MQYPKINSLWKRQGWYFDESKKKDASYQKNRQSFIIGDYSEPEFGIFNKWRVEEKIDGTNIRIMWQPIQLDSYPQLRFGGRTEDAQIPCHLLDYLQSTFTEEKFINQFPNANRVILFGEGCGPKIQKVGSSYSSSPKFILFDVWIGGWWLKREDVAKLANDLGIESAPDLGIMTEQEIIEFVKSKPLSKCSIIPQMIEGIIARPDPLCMFRNGSPIMWKLKCKEFIN
jgi:hypothetical protein